MTSGEHPASTVSKALIPAAGRGTRFLPFSKAVPKELAPIVTTPTVELVVAEASAAGISDVLVVIGPGKTALVDYFRPNHDLEEALESKGDSAAIDLVRRASELAAVDFVEQRTPRGLGDAVGYGRDFAAGEPLAVLLPDDLVDDRDALLRPMLDVYAEHSGVVLGLLDVPRADIGAYGSVALAPGSDENDDVVEISALVEKPAPDEAPSTLAIVGRYVLPPQIFDALEGTEPGAKGEIQLTDAMAGLLHDGVPVHGVVFRGRRYDTGNGLDYVKSVVQLAARHPDIGAEFSAWLGEYVRQPD